VVWLFLPLVPPPPTQNCRAPFNEGHGNLALTLCCVQLRDFTLRSCMQVIIDFLVRHGYLTPDMPDYLQLLAGLRSGGCS
jgi:hypothetical protein